MSYGMVALSGDRMFRRTPHMRPCQFHNLQYEFRIGNGRKATRIY
jgi:hypothetical protein